MFVCLFDKTIFPFRIIGVQMFSIFIAFCHHQIHFDCLMLFDTYYILISNKKNQFQWQHDFATHRIIRVLRWKTITIWCLTIFIATIAIFICPIIIALMRLYFLPKLEATICSSWNFNTWEHFTAVNICMNWWIYWVCIYFCFLSFVFIVHTYQNQ